MVLNVNPEPTEVVSRGSSNTRVNAVQNFLEDRESTKRSRQSNTAEEKGKKGKEAEAAEEERSSGGGASVREDNQDSVTSDSDYPTRRPAPYTRNGPVR